MTDIEQDMKDDALNEFIMDDVRDRLVASGMNQWTANECLSSVVPPVQDAIREAMQDALASAVRRTVIDIFTLVEGLESYQHASYYAQQIAGKYAINRESGEDTVTSVT
jgi:hypothetical protein